MVLVDTSVWINHLREGNDQLVSLLNSQQVCIHPFIIGELACGNLRNREEILQLLNHLPQLTPATQDEVLFFIEQQRLMGRGIGFIDAHLLACTVLSSGTTLWTQDKRLATLANAQSVSHQQKPK